ncbi:MAG: 4Fe-4S binding protein [Clostridium sp.]|nr:4Fe-4S binding protein [Clostridium sp.]
MAIIDFKEAKCRQCYRCVRSCQVGAIAFRGDHAFVMPNRCILCGECVQNCPQSAKRMSSELEEVRQMLASGEKVVLSLSPAYIGIFGYRRHRKVLTALKKLGFAEVRNSAEGAALATEEYVRLLAAGEMKNIITTACPAIINLIEIHYPDLIPYVAPVMIPSGIHVKLLQDEYEGDVKVVFAGPCIAEKDKKRKTKPDAVLSFEEIRLWLAEEGIDIDACRPAEEEPDYMGANLRYSLSAGLLAAVNAREKALGLSDNYRKLYASGPKDCIEICEALRTGQISNCFIELNSCHGGCINGPLSTREVSGFMLKMELEEFLPDGSAQSIWLNRNRMKVSADRTFEDRSVKEAVPTEEQIREILRKTGKNRPDQELNCGACGYSSCREKAIAVFRKKAELNMCVPYLHQRASSLSHMFMETTPNAILILDEDLKILDCSNAVSAMLGKKPEEIREHCLDEFTDTADVREVFRTKVSLQGQRKIDPEKNTVVFRNIAYIPESNYVIMTIIDMTEEERHLKEEQKKRGETIDLAQRVIHRQMMVAQQIAGLLGETTAETSTALTRLCSMFAEEKESARMEGRDTEGRSGGQ